MPCPFGPFSAAIYTALYWLIFQKYSLKSHAGVQLQAWQKLFTCVFP
jgi:hypothetical protein